MKRLEKIWKNVKKAPLFYILLMAVFILLPVITNGYFDGHDTKYHAQSIIGLEQNNSVFGIFNTHILEEMDRDFGYGEGIFYPQLSHQISAIIYHFTKPFGFSVLVSMRITHFLSIALSGIFMYLLMRRVTKNKTVSLLTALIYMTFPYHVSDIIVRDAFAEAFVFVFIPLIFLGLQELINKNYKKFFILFTIGYIGLINSHLVLTLYFTGFLVLISPFFIKQVFSKDAFKYLILSIITTTLVVLPFLVPMLENKRAQEYVVFTPLVMTSVDIVNNARLNFTDYFIPTIPEDNGHHKNIVMWLDLLAIVLSGVTILNFKKINKKSHRLLLVSCTVISVVSLLLPTVIVNWRWLPEILYKIQFPWRLETFAVFSLSILAGFALQYMSVNRRSILMLIVALSCLINVISVWQVQTDYDFDIYDYDNADYRPVELFHNGEYYQARSHNIITLSGDVDAYDLVDNGRNGISFKLANSVNSSIEIPRIYYLGYRVLAKKSSGETVDLPYHINSETGFIAIDLPEEYEAISIEYTGTKLTTITRVVSGVTLVAFLGYTVVNLKHEYAKHHKEKH